MSPDFLLEFVKWLFQLGTIGSLLGMMAIHAILRGWYFYKLLSGDAEKHAKVFQEARGLIESEHWGTRYRMFLKKVLGKLTKVIGDEHRFPNEKPKKLRIKTGGSTIEKAHKQSQLQKIFGINPFTAQSYEFCVLLALFYPVLSIFIGWVVGGNGMFGSLDVLPKDLGWPKRLMVLLGLSCAFGLAIWSRNLTGWKSSVPIIGAIFLIVVAAGAGGASSVVLVFGSVFLITGIISFSSAVHFSGIVTMTLFMTLAMALASTISSFASGILALIAILIVVPRGAHVTEWAYKKVKSQYKLWFYWLGLNHILLPISLLVLLYTENINAALLIVFFLILPLVNAPLDWLSLGITRGLLQSIRFRHHKFGKAILWSCLDLVLAVVALLLVSGVTVVAISLVNKVSPTPVIDLQALFISLSSLENWRDNLWIYFMLLSTLVPTAVHFALAGGALTLTVSDKKRKEILADMETNDLSAKRAWAYVSVMPAFGFVLAPTILIYSLYWLLHAYGDFLGGLLLAWTKMLATLIDPSLGQVVI